MIEQHAVSQCRRADDRRDGADHHLDLAKVDRVARVVATKSTFIARYDEMADRLPNSRLDVVDGAGLALFVDESARVNAPSRGFVNGLGARVTVLR